MPDRRDRDVGPSGFATDTRTGHRRGDARALPRPAGARLDAQHLRGLRERPGRAPACTRVSERPPAICFFDVTGYQPADRGARRRGRRPTSPLGVARLVQRSLRRARREGRQVARRRGDVLSSASRHQPCWRRSTCATAWRPTDLPPAHIGIHAGPVLFQEGDYFGRTVNAASRIADHAGRDQVLVSQDVVDAAAARRRALRPDRPGRAEGPARAARPVRMPAGRIAGQRNAPSGRADGA